MKILCVCISFFVLGLYNYSIAQILLKNTSLNSSLIGGYSFAPNRVEKTDESLDGWIRGFEIGIYKQVNGTKFWHQTLGMPRVGLNFQTIFMNKPDTFGFTFAVLPTIQLRLLTFKNAEIAGKIAIGGAYASKAFKRITNFDNRAISMPLNFALEFGLVYNQHLFKKLEFNTEVGYYHVSNGSFMMPNGGFNIYYLKGGFSYFLYDTPYKKRTPYLIKTNDNRAFYTAYFAGAYREQGTFAYRRQFPIFTFHQAYLKPLNKIYAVGVGLDLFYDATHALIGNSNLLASQVQESDKWLSAIGFCNELSIGKFAIPLEFYHYIYDLSVVKQPLYLRFGLTYKTYQNVYFGCYFKGSVNKYKSLESDFMEFAVGYQFKKKK
ncbi:MAG: acyloxyacyl hydrolase [Candidatus Methylacidiphilales bacterium]